MDPMGYSTCFSPGDACRQSTTGSLQPLLGSRFAASFAIRGAGGTLPFHRSGVVKLSVLVESWERNPHEPNMFLELDLIGIQRGSNYGMSLIIKIQ